MRILCGLALLAFVGVFYALPLHAALTLCVMPCCHPSSSATPAVSADMSGCHTECSVTSDAAEEATSTAAVVPHGGTKAFAAVPSMVVAVVSVDAPAAVSSPHASPLRSADAAIHVLNSVFRI